MAPSASAPHSSAPREAELAIVGAGPVGLYAAYYAGFRGIDAVVLETLPIVGGQITTFYPDTLIHDVAGFPQITGRELVERLLAQASAFPIPIRLGEEVVAAARSDDGFLLQTARTGGSGPREPGPSYRVRAVLVTAGIGSFSPQRIAEPAIEAFEGRGLRYLPPDGEEIRDTSVLVLGGSERAIDVALACARTARGVVLVHRRDRLPVSDDVRRRLDESPVRFLPFRELVALAGDASLERATLVDRRDSSTEVLDVRFVVPCFGFHADASALARFGVRREGDAILVDSRMATDQLGIYAAGDGATYPGKVRVLAADFGEACTAINNIAAAIVPGAHLFPGYSSHRKGAPRRPR